MDRRFFGVLLAFVLIVALLHTTVHLAVYGAGLSESLMKGISGLSFGEIKIGEEITTRYGLNSDLSRIIVSSEWLIVFVIVIFIYAKKRIAVNKEIKEVKSSNIIRKKGNETDLDVLYNLLKEKKKLRMSNVMKLFNIDKKVVGEWIKTLEDGNLLSMEYPRIGEPVLVLKGDIKK